MIGRADQVKVGDMIVAWAPPTARRVAAARNYLPQSDPLIKRVAAVGGDRVCAIRSRVTINGRAASLRRMADPRGRPLSWWNACHLLRKDELFLLSRNAPLAYDGRYFGVTQASQVIGRARLLWPS